MDKHGKRVNRLEDLLDLRGAKSAASPSSEIARLGAGFMVSKG